MYCIVLYCTVLYCAVLFECPHIASQLPSVSTMDHCGQVLLTLLLYGATNQGNPHLCDLIEQSAHNQTSMQFSPFQTLENSVVFDWFITLEQKERYLAVNHSYCYNLAPFWK